MQNFCSLVIRNGRIITNEELECIYLMTKYEMKALQIPSVIPHPLPLLSHPPHPFLPHLPRPLLLVPLSPPSLPPPVPLPVSPVLFPLHGLLPQPMESAMECSRMPRVAVPLFMRDRIMVRMGDLNGDRLLSCRKLCLLNLGLLFPKNRILPNKIPVNSYEYHVGFRSIQSKVSRVLLIF